MNKITKIGDDIIVTESQHLIRLERKDLLDELVTMFFTKEQFKELCKIEVRE